MVSKLFFKVKTPQQNTNSEPIPLLKSHVDISADSARKMNTDSIVVWKYLCALMKAMLNAKVAAFQCGKLF